jgi:hypothetical protein
VSDAARVAGFPRTNLYHLRKIDTAFASAWDEAAQLGADGLEDEGRRRAHDGVEKPLTCAKGLILDDAGDRVNVREYSDTLLIFLLKGAKPEKYRERQQVEVSGQLDINTLAAEADAKFNSFASAVAVAPLLGQPDASAEG